MSMCHWVTEGIGIEFDGRIFERISADKVLKKLEKPDSKEYQELVTDVQAAKSQTQEVELIDEYLTEALDWSYGRQWPELASKDVTCHLAADNDGGERSFLYFPPLMPWEVTEDTPKSIDAVHKLLVDCVQSITDMSEEEIESLIDNDLYEYGCG